MIYDCFMFFNEIDLLTLRLKIMSEKVDKFVIVESVTTHSGKHKKLILPELLQYFDYNIDYSIYTGGGRSAKERERNQREHIKEALRDCEDDDTILFSDLDEIYKPSIINPVKGLYVVEMDVFYYYINTRLYKNNKPKIWTSAKIGDWRTIKNKCLTSERKKENLPRIKNAGWHFSYLGNANYIKNKLTSFLHHDTVNTNVLNRLSDRIKNLEDPLGRKEFSLKAFDFKNHDEEIKKHIDILGKYIWK